MRFILLSCIGAATCLIAVSCQTAVARKQPVKTPPNVEKEFAAARRSFEDGDLKKAIPRLKKISTQHAHSEVADDSLMMLAQAYEKQQLSKEALQTYLTLANSEISSPMESTALIRAARLHVRFNQFKEAGALIERIERSSSADKTTKSEALELKAEILLAENRLLDAMEVYVELANNSPDQRVQEKYRVAAQDLLDTRLNPDDVREVSERSAFGFLRAIGERRFVSTRVPRTLEFRSVVGAMNALSGRVRMMLSEESERLEALRFPSQHDELTRVMNRSQFLRRVESALAREDAHAGGSLLIARIGDIAALNRQLGRPAVDTPLRTLGHHLLHLAASQPDWEAGRLNGTDFALLASGDDDAAALAQRMQETIAAAIAHAQLGHDVRVPFPLGACAFSPGTRRWCQWMKRERVARRRS